VAEGDLPLRKSPLILGHEIVGVVAEVGKEVTKYSGIESYVVTRSQKNKDCWLIL
jgi:D-arabinose 1-dehydrogenase-like Zn-dependent alcohol dehydrogenase